MNIIDKILNRQLFFLNHVMTTLIVVILLLLGIFLFAVPVTVKHACLFRVADRDTVYIKTVYPVIGRQAVLQTDPAGHPVQLNVSITGKTHSGSAYLVKAVLHSSDISRLPMPGNAYQSGFWLTKTPIYKLLL